MLIPLGFARVSPSMLVQDVKRLLVFLAQAFDARSMELSLRPDGDPANTQLKIADCMSMLADVPPGQ
jgi:hypothetical protein